MAERTGHWALSRNYAERATLFSELDDERTVGRLLNNLGGLSLLLGKPEQAIAQLKASFAVAVEVDSQADAGQAMNGLATVHLGLGDWDAADERGRSGSLDGRGLPRRDRTGADRPRPLAPRAQQLDEAETCFRVADATFEQLSSVSHRAGAWVALGDLAAQRGEDAELARLYRNAAESLQDLRFRDRKEEAMKTRLLFVVLSGSVLFASWSGRMADLVQLGRRELALVAARLDRVRPLAAVLGLITCLIAAGCVSSSAQEGPVPTLEALWRAPARTTRSSPAARTSVPARCG